MPKPLRFLLKCPPPVGLSGELSVEPEPMIPKILKSPFANYNTKIRKVKKIIKNNLKIKKKTPKTQNYVGHGPQDFVHFG